VVLPEIPPAADMPLPKAMNLTQADRKEMYMKISYRLVLRIACGESWDSSLAGVWMAYLSLRYSPEYMLRENFRDLGTVYDYRFFPERKLSTSPDPFTFKTDSSQEAKVQEAFSSVNDSMELDSFLGSTRTQAFLVIRDDAIIYERYFMGFQRDSLVTSYSIAVLRLAMIRIAIQMVHQECG
jgi:hypothetical protein